MDTNVNSFNSRKNLASDAATTSEVKFQAASHMPIPGSLMVIRRNGALASFDSSKIASAITKAFWDVEGTVNQNSRRLTEIVEKLTDEIMQAFLRRLPITGGTLSIEDIQDQVELALMRNEHHQVARSYVLYREEHRKLREMKLSKLGTAESSLSIILDNGQKANLDVDELEAYVEDACINLVEVSAAPIIKDTIRSLFDGIPIREVRKALIMSARTLIEQEPNYSYVAARLLLKNLQREALRFLNLPVPKTSKEMTTQYAPTLAASIRRGIEVELLDPKLQSFDLDQLGHALSPERDLQFTYLGLQTLYDRYFLHKDGVRFELPQAFFMRVAMGLAIEEKEKDTGH